MATHLHLVRPGGPDDDTLLVDLSALPGDTLWRLESAPLGGYTLGLLDERDGWIDGGSHDAAQPAIDAAAEAWHAHRRLYAAFHRATPVPGPAPQTPPRLDRVWLEGAIFAGGIALCWLLFRGWLS